MTRYSMRSLIFKDYLEAEDSDHIIEGSKADLVERFKNNLKNLSSEFFVITTKNNEDEYGNEFLQLQVDINILTDEQLAEKIEQAVARDRAIRDGVGINEWDN